MNTIVKIKRLARGQEVAIANCRSTAHVIRRVGNGLYLVDYKGQEITMPRASLAVLVAGAWRFGAHNSQP